MTLKAIALLEENNEGQPGFFLQVEGASIDKQAHSANACAEIGETAAFDKAVAAGVEYARRNPDTLVIVTADHTHAEQIVSIPTDADHPAGLLTILRTTEGAPLAVSYGTNAYHRAQNHRRDRPGFGGWSASGQRRWGDRPYRSLQTPRPGFDADHWP